MKTSLRHKITTLILCASLLLIPRPAKADSLTNTAIEAGLGIAAAGAAIGVAIYYVVRKDSSITGCATFSSDSLTLQNEADQKTFTLIGDIATIKPGDRVRVSGKKKKTDPSGKRDFLVEKLTKNYGPCKVSVTPSATPKGAISKAQSAPERRVKPPAENLLKLQQEASQGKAT